MPEFSSERSKLHLSEAHPYLQKVLLESIRTFDFSIIQGYRGPEEQEIDFKKGTTRAHFGSSAHNYKPCLGVDCIPYPFNDSEWEDEKIFEDLADHLFMAAETCRKSGLIPKDVFFRWGGGKQDGGPQTKNFNWDQPHFELHPWQNYIVKGK